MGVWDLSSTTPHTCGLVGKKKEKKLDLITISFDGPMTKESSIVVSSKIGFSKTDSFH